MKKIRLLFVVFFVLALFASCNDSGDTTPKEKDFHVSIVSGATKQSRAMVKTDFEVKGDITKKNVVSGKYKGSLTPTEFVLQLQSIFLYNPVDKEDVSKGVKDVAKLFEEFADESGCAIPWKINALASKDLQIEYDSSLYNTIWNGFGFEINIETAATSDCPEYVNNPNYDRYWTGTTIAVSKTALESLVNGDLKNLDQEVIFAVSDDTVWLNFNKMLPFEKTGERDTLFGFSKVLFQTGIKKNKIMMGNFTGRDRDQDAIIEYGPYKMLDDAGCYVASYMDAIDFSKYSNCEITIAFDIKDILKVYETTTNGIYTIVLNPDNPFGISLTVSNYGEAEKQIDLIQSSIEYADAAPIYCFGYKRPTGVCLSYANPNKLGVDHFEIYYSESPIQNVPATEGILLNDTQSELVLNNAEQMYSGKLTVFRDAENMTYAGTYWVRTVFENGEVSNFRSFKHFINMDSLIL